MLLVFPHAGGFARAYDPLVKSFTDPGSVMVYEYRGHGVRYGKGFYKDTWDAVGEALGWIGSHRKAGPFFLMGHSAGAYVAYEIARALERDGEPADGLVLSGQNAPDFMRELPDDDGVADYILSLGGVEEEMVRSEAYIKYLLPIVQADFNVLRTYDGKSLPALTKTPALLLWGRGDTCLTEEGRAGWERCLLAGLEKTDFDGGHFYFQDHWPAFCGRVHAFLKKKAPEGEGT